MEMNQEELADKLWAVRDSYFENREYNLILKQKQTATDLNDSTQSFITERGSGDVNKEHEVRLIETASRKPAKEETPIKCEDILKPLPGQDQPIRTNNDNWSGRHWQSQPDIHFTFPFTFRELNLLKGKEFSLVGLLHHFFIETKEAGICRYDFQVVFILDGLDENQIWTDVTAPTSVDVLLTNLIRGDLLPSARIWITTRPAAANQIPAECVGMVTEVRGFTDPQKEEYFRKRFSDNAGQENHLPRQEITKPPHHVSHPSLLLDLCYSYGGLLHNIPEKRECPTL
ncbi:NLR family CARD domain-containing protein 3 [Merluccius polli]|uniref:NLR family CARD domain-containing protein 3 n=1 Tax=Merluccius polli TaxID=89951 RepID=A0AA47MBB3_MERPO|nr:NLR family CARD domain-containing protein 3 [Merluccius polli]